MPNIGATEIVLALIVLAVIGLIWAVRRLNRKPPTTGGPSNWNP
jgi:hypothetical protein